MDLRHIDGLQSRDSERRLEFPTGGSIEIHSTHNADYLRGAGLNLAVLDEAAYMEPHVWPEVVRPMLLDRGGGALFLSTPRGLNHFYRLYQLGLDPNETDWISFRFPSTANPAISEAEMAAIRRTTSERVYREEYLAEFIADSGQVFRGVYEAANASTDARPMSDHQYVAGVDWGRENDFTCIAIIDLMTMHMVALDRFSGVRWSLQRERLQALVKKWRPSVIWAEANSIGAVNIEQLQDAGLPVRAFHTTATSKAPLIDALALAIETGELHLLPDPVLLHELALYGMERLPSGVYRYGAPPGEHDDTVIATALAWYAVQRGGVFLDFA